MSESVPSPEGPEDTSPDPGSIPGRRVRAAEGLIERNVGGQTFVLTPDSKMAILENATAHHLWTRVCDAGEAGIMDAELVDGLIGEFKVDHDTAHTDVASYLDQLLADNVFEIMPG